MIRERRAYYVLDGCIYCIGERHSVEHHNWNSCCQMVECVHLSVVVLKSRIERHIECDACFAFNSQSDNFLRCRGCVWCMGLSWWVSGECHSIPFQAHYTHTHEMVCVCRVCVAAAVSVGAQKTFQWIYYMFEMTLGKLIVIVLLACVPPSLRVCACTSVVCVFIVNWYVFTNDYDKRVTWLFRRCCCCMAFGRRPGEHI